MMPPTVDGDGVELQVGDWVKRVSRPVGHLNLGVVSQITSLHNYDVYINGMGPYNPNNFVKVTRHPHADIIIAAANDMNVEVDSYTGVDVFEELQFFGDVSYRMIDRTLQRPTETAKQKQLREAKEALAKAQALVDALED